MVTMSRSDEFRKVLVKYLEFFGLEVHNINNEQKQSFVVQPFYITDPFLVASEIVTRCFLYDTSTIYLGECVIWMNRREDNVEVPGGVNIRYRDGSMDRYS